MIKDFRIAIGDFKKYGILSERKWGRVVGYTILLLLICSIGLIIVPTFTIGAKTLNVIWEDIPNFTLSSEGFKIEKDFDVEFSGVKLMATNSRQVAFEDFNEDVITGILMDEDSVIMQNMGNKAEFRYDELGMDFVITKPDLSVLKNIFVISGVLVCVLLFITRCISFILSGLFIGAVAGMISIFMKMQLPTANLVKLGMYSQTLPLVVSAILMPFGIAVPGIILYVVSIALIVLFFREQRPVGFVSD